MKITGQYKYSIEIFEIPPYGKKKKYGVNWAALGTKSPRETLMFAKQLSIAAKKARMKSKR